MYGLGGDLLSLAPYHLTLDQDACPVPRWREALVSTDRGSSCRCHGGCGHRTPLAQAELLAPCPGGRAGQVAGFWDGRGKRERKFRHRAAGGEKGPPGEPEPGWGMGKPLAARAAKMAAKLFSDSALTPRGIRVSAIQVNISSVRWQKSLTRSLVKDFLCGGGHEIIPNEEPWPGRHPDRG